MKSNTNVKVLIVDDVPEMVACLGEIISQSFPAAELQHAYSEDEAIEKCFAFHPDYILLDIQLGNESGLQVLKQVRSRKSKARVIMVTNFNDEVHRKICAVLGADAFVDKSKGFHLIPEIIDAYIRDEKPLPSKRPYVIYLN